MAFKENIKTGQAYRVVVDQDPITDEFTYDRLSFWTAAQDVEFLNKTTLEEMSGTFYYASGILAAGQNVVEITGDNITYDGLLDIYVPDEYCKLTPNTIVRDEGGGKVTITFPEEPVREEDIEVRVVCKSFGNVAGG